MSSERANVWDGLIDYDASTHISPLPNEPCDCMTCSMSRLKNNLEIHWKNKMKFDRYKIFDKSMKELVLMTVEDNLKAIEIMEVYKLI